MTVPVQDPINQYTANGSTAIFPYQFLIYDTSHLKVYLDDTLTTSGYTVDGVNNTSGGNVTFTTNLASGVLVTILREVPAERTADYQNAGDFLASTVNADFNKLWMYVQQIVSRFDNRTLTFKSTEDRGSNTNQLPTPQEGQVLYWSGGDVQSAPLANLATDVSFLNTMPIAPTMAAAKASTTLTDGQGLFILGYSAANDGGGGAYRYEASNTDTANNGTVIALDTLPGRLVHTRTTAVTANTFGAVGDGVTDSTMAIFAAAAWATAEKAEVGVLEGVYILSGANTLRIDLAFMSMRAYGQVIFNCTSMTAAHAVQVFGSLTYAQGSHYINTTNELFGIVFIGGLTAGRHGLLVGDGTHLENCQTVVRGCSFFNFDSNIKFMNNGWRTTFHNCVSMTPLNRIVEFPAGLANAGESISFYHCQFNDGNKLFDVSVDNFQIYLYSCSVLNTQINISGSGSKVVMFGGNYENPANAVAYTYAIVSGSASLLELKGTGLVTNPTTTFTDSLFNISHAEATLILDGVTIPDGTHLQFETTNGVRSFCKGPGRVVTKNLCFWPGSGGYKGVVKDNNNNDVINGNWEGGNTNGWTVAAYGTGGSTAVADASAAKNGTYGLLITTVASGGINVTQQKACAPGQMVMAFCNYRVNTNGGAPVGYIQVQFVDAAGNVITTHGDEFTSATWAIAGSACCRYAPAGTAAVIMILNGQPSASANVIHIDDVVLNVL